MQDIAGRDPFLVVHTYAKATGGRHTLRRNMTGFGTSSAAAGMGYVYSSASGSLDAAASRVSRVTFLPVGGSVFTPVAQYEYLGSDHLVGTDLLARALYEAAPAITGSPR